MVIFIWEGEKRKAVSKIDTTHTSVTCIGARVASQHCLILRAGKLTVSKFNCCASFLVNEFEVILDENQLCQVAVIN